MQEIVALFERQENTKCDLVVSSSGKLTAQIRQGAPYAIFVSADSKYPGNLHQDGFGEVPKVYAYGKLVIWSSQKLEVDNLENWTMELGRIAIANPRFAPYGVAAEQALNSLNIYSELEANLVFGESISQVNNMIFTEAVVAGFTALAVVRAPKLRTEGFWQEVDTSLYEPISQSVIRLKNDPGSTELARQFYNFLFSVEAQQILKDFGYSTP